jgi:hypothetical protein
MKRLPKLVTIAVFLFCVAAFVLAPLFGVLPIHQGIISSLSRASIAFVLIPLGLFYCVVDAAQFGKNVKVNMNPTLGLSGVAAIATLPLILAGLFLSAAIAAMLSWYFLYRGVRIWARALPTPRQVIIAEGERILANETDPREKQKFRWALDRFKKG